MPPELADETAEIVAPVIDNPEADVRAAIAELKAETPPETAAATTADANPPVERPRNERGQFIKADGSVDPDQSPVKVPDADPAKANDPQPSTAAVAPTGWSAEAKAEFGKLSPVVQAAVLKRESEINDGGARWSEEKKTLMGHFEPLRAASEKHKQHPAEVLKHLAAANDYLERDPPAAIAWLAKSYGVDLSKLAATPSSPTPTPQPQPDPVVAELKSKVSQFEQRFQQQEQAETNTVIRQFATAPGHEHFESVKADMGYLMIAAKEAGRVLTLDQAYEQAVWANAETRSKLMAAQTATSEAARKTREATEKARRGAISVNGAPNGGTPPPPAVNPKATVEDDVRSAIAQLRH